MERLVGRTVNTVDFIKDDHDFTVEVILKFNCGSSLRMYHEQDCCESFCLEDIVGDIEDIIGNPLTMCEETYNQSYGDDEDGSHTWTYYKFATIKGYVDLRFIGSSNGYYSEACDLEIKVA